MRRIISRKRYINEDSDDEESGHSHDMPDITKLMQLAEKKNIFRDNNHIYFRCDVTTLNANKLCNTIDEYNREHDATCANVTTSIIIPKPIYLHITSNGGDVDAGLMAYDYIKNSKIPIYTIAEGCVASSGANIFMAGCKRFMSRSAHILVHQIRHVHNGYSVATFREICDDTANSTELMTQIINLYMENIRQDAPEVLTKEKLEDCMLHDILWSYETCKKNGIADELYTNYNDRDVIDSKQFLQRDLSEIANSHSSDMNKYKPSKEFMNRIAEYSKSQENIMDVIKKQLNTISGNDDDKPKKKSRKVAKRPKKD